MLWTKSYGRLQCVKENSLPLHWIFLPGGPGLGSESLADLTAQLTDLPGSLWHFDLPGDGSNTTSNNRESFRHWPSALLEAAEKLQPAILVAHSTGGMYALSTPELENLLAGLILLDSAPDASWQAAFAQIAKSLPLDEHQNHPSNKTLKELTIASAPLLFTKKGLAKGVKLLEGLPYNYETCLWSEEHFDASYRARWIPKTLPTLILAGEEDRLTPLKLFTDPFHRDNIVLKSIRNAGHFPWIENPQDVAAEFNAFSRLIL